MEIARVRRGNLKTRNSSNSPVSSGTRLRSVRFSDKEEISEIENESVHQIHCDRNNTAHVNLPVFSTIELDALHKSLDDLLQTAPCSSTSRHDDPKALQIELEALLRTMDNYLLQSDHANFSPETTEVDALRKSLDDPLRSARCSPASTLLHNGRNALQSKQEALLRTKDKCLLQSAYSD